MFQFSHSNKTINIGCLCRPVFYDVNKHTSSLMADKVEHSLQNQNVCNIHLEILIKHNFADWQWYKLQLKWFSLTKPLPNQNGRLNHIMLLVPGALWSGSNCALQPPRLHYVNVNVVLSPCACLERWLVCNTRHHSKKKNNPQKKNKCGTQTSTNISSCPSSRG